MRLNKSFKLQIANLILGVMAFGMLHAQNPSINLPTTEILGQEYYIYEVGKGESVYGIAKKFNWDPEELMRINSETVSKLKKGARLYYPTGKMLVVTEEEDMEDISDFKPDPIRHTVKKGETIYSISRQYGIPLAYIYEVYPSAKKGIKAGETIVIPQNPNSQYIFHVVKNGDNLSSIAKKYHTTVEDILKDNTGISDQNLKDGEVVRVAYNSNAKRLKTEMVTEDRVTGITSYKVTKDDTWDKIAHKTGTEVDLLKEANENIEQPEKDQIINVPVVETVEVEKEIFTRDEREASEEGIQEIYDSIRGVTPGNEIEPIRMTLLLDDPKSNKDIDFTRGVLLALDGMAQSNYRVEFNVLDGRVATNNLLSELENTEPDVVIATADKAFPAFLADYGNTNGIQIINVFDLKNDLYEDNSSMVQLLTPSPLFNSQAAQNIHSKYRNHKLLTVGTKDENDGIAEELVELFGENSDNISLEEFGTYQPDIDFSLLIYAYPTKKEEVADFIQGIDNLTENYPGTVFNIVGRPNWVTFIEDFGNKFGDYKVIVPSKVWLDEDSEAWQQFCENYDAMFGGSPIRSIPNFAASGYDTVNYFIPMLARRERNMDFGIESPFAETLQSNMNLRRENNWGGLINVSGYLLNFQPENVIEKETLK